MKLTLFDTNELLSKAWRQEFADVENVEVLCCNLIHLPQPDALATAGNSFGVMTGGIDLALREKYGQNVQDSIQNYIINSFALGMPVGHTLTLAIIADEESKGKQPSIIYAPTMERPMKIGFLNVVYAMIAIVQTASEFESVAIPGLGTGVGEVPYDVAAKAMRIGYDAAMAIKEAGL